MKTEDPQPTTLAAVVELKQMEEEDSDPEDTTKEQEANCFMSTIAITRTSCKPMAEDFLKAAHLRRRNISNARCKESRRPEESGKDPEVPEEETRSAFGYVAFSFFVFESEFFCLS